MTFYNYQRSITLNGVPFTALIMAAMWKADTPNLAALCEAFPAVWDELNARYSAPGGMLDSDLFPSPTVKAISTL